MISANALGFLPGKDGVENARALQRAVDLYSSDKKAFRALQKAGMTADFTWKNSAGEYLDIYAQLLN